MKNVIEVDDNNIESMFSAGTPTWITFGAEWCGPCKTFNPTLDIVASEYVGRVLTCHVDVDSSPQLSERYGIRAVPTHIMFKDGSEVKRMQGSMTRQRLQDAYKDLST